MNKNICLLYAIIAIMLTACGVPEKQAIATPVSVNPPVSKSQITFEATEKMLGDYSNVMADCISVFVQVINDVTSHHEINDRDIEQYQSQLRETKQKLYEILDNMNRYRPSLFFATSWGKEFECLQEMFTLFSYCSDWDIDKNGIVESEEANEVLNTSIQRLEKLDELLSDFKTAYAADCSSKQQYDINHPSLGKKNALRNAKLYIQYMPFSYKDLVKQLEYEGYLHEEAIYGADNCGADWYEQAAKAAKQYLTYSSFSKQGLIEQLEFEGYTHEQAVYGVEHNGYQNSGRTYKGSSDAFTNQYGTATTICAHPGCNNNIAPSGDTNCCTVHSNKCLQCGKYIDEDAMYCVDCLIVAVDKIAGN